MNELRFEWDERKKKVNIKKHGVSFDEARTIFYDENAIQFIDPDHSEDEDRFILLGMIFKLRILVVCHCFRKSETVISSLELYRPGRRMEMRKMSIGGIDNERPL